MNAVVAQPATTIVLDPYWLRNDPALERHAEIDVVVNNRFWYLGMAGLVQSPVD
jgi:hypothetical protein